jgi:hypothetical protein
LALFTQEAVEAVHILDLAGLAATGVEVLAVRLTLTGLLEVPIAAVEAAGQEVVLMLLEQDKLVVLVSLLFVILAHN